MALERLEVNLSLSMFVTSWFKLRFCSAAINCRASKNSSSKQMLVACRPAIKTDFLRIIFYDNCQMKLFERRRKPLIAVRLQNLRLACYLRQG